MRVLYSSCNLSSFNQQKSSRSRRSPQTKNGSISADSGRGSRRDDGAALKKKWSSVVVLSRLERKIIAVLETDFRGIRYHKILAKHETMCSVWCLEFLMDHSHGSCKSDYLTIHRYA